MLFTLYGDYAYPAGRDVALGSLVRLGDALGLSETAVRSAVARLAREHWLQGRRDGNRSYYGLSPVGRKLIDEGTARIYRTREQPWTGAWCLLHYSIPESSRPVRDRMRRQLAWLGFGPMGGGAYVSPRDVSVPAQALLARHGAERFARVFAARLTGPGNDEGLVAQCWDLAAIGKRYEHFVRHYEPLQRRHRVLAARGGVDEREAFVTRFALTHDFRRFPFIDPDLPDRLLPRDWAGARARAFFESYHALLTAPALRFFDRVAVNGRRDQRTALPSSG